LKKDNLMKMASLSLVERSMRMAPRNLLEKRLPN